MSSAISPVVGPFEQLEADELARAEDVMYNFNLLRVWANALALPATGWGVDGHGDLSGSTAIMHSAASSEIADAGDYFTGDTVEAALQEAGADIVALQTAVSGSFKFIGKSIDNTKYGDVSGSRSGTSTATITIPAGTTSTGIQVFFNMRFTPDSGSSSYIDVVIGGTLLRRLTADYPNSNESGYATYIASEGWDNTADVTVNITYAMDPANFVQYIELSVFAL